MTEQPVYSGTMSKLSLCNLNSDFGRCLFLNGVKVRVRSDLVFAATAFLYWGTFCGRCVKLLAVLVSAIDQIKNDLRAACSGSELKSPSASIGGIVLSRFRHAFDIGSDESRIKFNRFWNDGQNT